MKADEAKEYIKANWRGLWKADADKGKKAGCVCPLCDSGSGAKGTGIKEDTREQHAGKNFLHCYNVSCGFSGDALSLLAKELHKSLSGRDFVEVMEEAGRRLGISIEWEDKGAGLKAPAHKVQAKKAAVEPVEEKQDFSAYCEAMRAGLADERAREYLEGRCIFDASARLGVGFDSEWKNPKGGKVASPRMIIPFAGGVGYLARALDNPERGAKQNAGEVGLFNAEALKGGGVVFLCEGWADAASVEQCGFHAVSLNGCNNYNVIAEAAAGFNGVFVIAFDCDANGAGQKAAARAKEELEKRGFLCMIADICGGVVGQDANSFFVADDAGFRWCLEAAEDEAKKILAKGKKPDSLLDYVQGGGFARDTFSGVCMKTGFPAFDKWLDDGLFVGRLYVVAARTGLGKTAFMWQIGENLAAAGVDCLYFTLELGRAELLSRAYVRRAHKRGREIRLNSVLRGEDVSEESKGFFSSVGDRLSVIDGGYSETVSSIRDYVKQYKRRNNAPLCVIVDYLQAAAESNGKPENVGIADAAKALKQLAKDFSCVVLCASSMARTTYSEGVSFASFYGSCNIEYTCDCVVGLQYSVIDSPAWNNFPSTMKEAEKKAARAKLLDDAENASPREISLVGLKYRGNNPHIRIPMKFDSGHFDIQEAGAGTFKAKSAVSSSDDLSAADLEELLEL